MIGGRGYIGIMKKRMQLFYVTVRGLCRDNAKEHGNYYAIVGGGSYRDNGKDNGNYLIVPCPSVKESSSESSAF